MLRQKEALDRDETGMVGKTPTTTSIVGKPCIPEILEPCSSEHWALALRKAEPVRRPLAPCICMPLLTPAASSALPFPVAALPRDGRTDGGTGCFMHSGLVVGLGSLVESVMGTLCWTGSDWVGFIKALKYIELSAFNMFAVTNLAICVNLALVVSVSRAMYVCKKCRLNLMVRKKRAISRHNVGHVKPLNVLLGLGGLGRRIHRPGHKLK